MKAQPGDKPIQRLDAMSGGEKSLTALAFIFAIQRHNPAPFYALDEVDAFLDAANADRVGELVDELAGDAQFVVVSHRSAMLERSERAIGVTMQGDNVSAVTGITSAVRATVMRRFRLMTSEEPTEQRDGDSSEQSSGEGEARPEEAPRGSERGANVARERSDPRDDADDIPLNITGHEDREPPGGSDDAAALLGDSPDPDDETTAQDSPEATGRPTRTRTKTSNRSKCWSSSRTTAKSTRGISTWCGSPTSSSSVSTTRTCARRAGRCSTRASSCA